MVLIALIFTTSAAEAADGTFDTTFGDGGKTIFAVTTSQYDVPHVLRATADGKLIVAGGCGNASNPCLARLTANGAMDTSFGIHGDGTVQLSDLLPVSTLAFADMQVEPDGRLVLAGFDGFNGWSAIVKADGTAVDKNQQGQTSYLSISFPSGILRINAVALQSDGRILAAGSLDSAGNVGMVVCRVSADSTTLDTTFGTQGSTSFRFANNSFDVARAIALQSDGRIVLAGTTAVIIGSTMEPNQIGLVRLLGNGQLDSSFGSDVTGLLAYESGISTVTSLAIDAQNRLVVAGRLGQRWLVDRRLQGGGIDSSFDQGSPLSYSILEDSTSNQANSIFVTSDSIIVAGNTYSAFDSRKFWAVSRINFDGTLNSSFGGGGSSYASYATSSIGETDDSGAGVVVTTSGIVVAGYATLSGGAIDFGLGRLKFEHIFANSFE